MAPLTPVQVQGLAEAAAAQMAAKLAVTVRLFLAAVKGVCETAPRSFRATLKAAS